MDITDQEDPVDRVNAADALSAAWKALNANDIRKVLGIIHELTTQDPENAEAFDVLGCAYARVGQEKVGLAFLQKAVSLDPTEISHFRRYIQLSIVYGYTARAIRDLEERLDQNSDSAWLWLLHGYALQKQGHRETALRSYLTALKVAGDEEHEGFVKAWRTTGPQDPAQMLPLLKQNSAADGDKLNFARAFAQIAITEEDFEAARLAIDAGKRTHSGDPVLEAAAIDFLTAKGHLDAALRRAQNAVSARADSQDLILAYVRVLWAQGRCSEALYLCNSVLSEQPDFLRLLDLTGQILLSMRQHGAALTTLTQFWDRTQGRYQGPLDVPSAPAEDFCFEDHQLLVELDRTDSASFFFLPMLHQVMAVASRICVSCSPEMKLLIQILFPGVQVVDRAQEVPRSMEINWFPVKFSQLVPFVLRGIDDGTTPALASCQLPAFQGDMARRQFGLSGNLKTVIIEQPLASELWASGEASGLDPNTYQVVGLSVQSTTISIMSHTDEPDTEHPFTFQHLAALLSVSDCIVARNGLIAELASALGRPVWIIGSSDGLPRWYLYNQTTPSPVYPNLSLKPRKAGSSNVGLLMEALTEFTAENSHDSKQPAS